MAYRDDEWLVDATDERLTRVLEQAPHVKVPPGFATRVAAEALARFGALPAGPQATQFGRYAAWASGGVLPVAMLLLAGIARSSPLVGFALEATMCAEFVALTLYLALQPRVDR